MLGVELLGFSVVYFLLLGRAFLLGHFSLLNLESILLLVVWSCSGVFLFSVGYQLLEGDL